MIIYYDYDDHETGSLPISVEGARNKNPPINFNLLFWLNRSVKEMVDFDTHNCGL